MSNFERASNFVINELYQGVYNVTGEQVNRGFELLQKHVVTSAYDDVESYDQPKCHPRTREQVQDELVQWVKENNEKEKVQWVYGPAGAGKSAIARSIFDRDDMEDVRCGFFAFKRGSGSRDKAAPLIPTLAYQLATTIDISKEHICRAIERDPKIFSKSVETQMRTLIVNPLEICSKDQKDHTSCFIIDGLDECTDARVQATIISSVVNTLAASKVHLKFIIFSRPEVEIRTTFKKINISCYCHVVELNERFKPDQDIEIYLRDKFNEIKRSHGISRGSQWPAESQIMSIIGKSTGQFIYPATVIKYINNNRKSPINQLEIVLGLQPNHQENPFSDLDSLYAFILEQSYASYQKVSNIFMTLLFRRGQIIDSIKQVSEFTGETPANIRYTLTDLHSVVKVPEYFFEELTFHHASFGDFLKDETRSDQYYIDSVYAHTYMAKQYIIYMGNISEDNEELRYQTAQYFASHVMRSSNECLKYIVEEYGLDSYYFSGFSFQNRTGTLVLYGAIGNVVVIITNGDLTDVNDHVIATQNVDIPRKIFHDQDEILLPFISYEDYFGEYHFGKENVCGYRISTATALLLADLGAREDLELRLAMCSANILETEDEKEEIIFDVEKAFDCRWFLFREYVAGCFEYFQYIMEWFEKARHINPPKQIYFHIFNTMLRDSEDVLKYEWEPVSPSIDISRFIEPEREAFIQAMKRRDFEPWMIKKLQTRIDLLIQARNEYEARERGREVGRK